MKVPSTKALRSTVAAVSFAAIVALTGCSDDQGASGASDAGGEQQPAASDGGGEQAMPEPDTSDVPDVVAEVNGQKISKDEFVTNYESQFQQAMQEQQQQGSGQELDQTELKKQVADQLVGNELLLQAAHDSGIEPTTKQVNSILEDVAKQNDLQSADEVVAALEQQGMSEEDVRQDAADQYALTAYVEQEADVKEPSDEELKKQYDQAVEQQSQAGGQQGETPSFEDSKEQLAQEAVSKQQNEAAMQMVTELREQGDVTVNL